MSSRKKVKALIADFTHPSFPENFTLRVELRGGETVKEAGQRAFTLYRMDTALGGYRAVSGGCMAVFADGTWR